MLKTRNTRPAKVYYAGALPGLLYGAELGGLSERVKKQHRAEALKVQALCARGVCSNLVWGAPPSKMHPAAMADWMAVERYCKEIWLAEEVSHKPDQPVLADIESEEKELSLTQQLESIMEEEMGQQQKQIEEPKMQDGELFKFCCDAGGVPCR